MNSRLSVIAGSWLLALSSFVCAQKGLEPMALLKPNVAYRIGVRFDPPLSTVAQLRVLPERAYSPNSVLVGFSQYEASVIIVFPTTKQAERIDYGSILFKVSNGPGAGSQPISVARVESACVEATFKP